MRFRPDENSVRHIKTHGPAKLAKEVIAALKIRATSEGAGKCRRVKTDTLHANACGKFRLGPLAQRRRIDRIHIIEKGPEWQLPLVKVFFGAECRIEPYAEVVKEKKIQADHGICATTNGLHKAIAGWCGKAG